MSLIPPTDNFILGFEFQEHLFHAQGERRKQYNYWQSEVIVGPNFLPVPLHTTFQELSPAFALPPVLLTSLCPAHCQ